MRSTNRGKPNTREAYYRNACRFYEWCSLRNVTLTQLEPMIVALYIEELTKLYPAPTVKQHLAAIRKLFDYLVVGQVIPFNPAASVRGMKYSIQKGKTPVLSPEETRQLLNSIDTSSVVGLRDRALIALMTYTFARVSATINMKVGDYYLKGRRGQIRLLEKGGKFHEMPAHHNLEEYLEAYIKAAEIGEDRKGFLFRTTKRKTKILTENGMSRQDVLRMIKRRSKKAALPFSTCCHTFRATGITAYRKNGGDISKAQPGTQPHKPPKFVPEPPIYPFPLPVPVPIPVPI